MIHGINSIIGLKVVDIRTIRIHFTKNDPVYILFSDKKTYIQLEEQDYCSFHDASTSAREIIVCQNEEEWKRIFENKKRYPKLEVKQGKVYV
uniref:Uncharacterized protein n=1 Tax=viral metagenome TaxID=1070528 RepID=A0A6H2A5S3_9ZZZZ